MWIRSSTEFYFRFNLDMDRSPGFGSACADFVNTGFQVLFHSPPGVLFTFPSQYSALSVTKEYSALGGGPPDFPQGFPCPAVLWILPLPSAFRVRGFHPLRLAFPGHSASSLAHLCSP